MTDALMPLAADAGLLLPPQRVLSVRDLSVQFQQQGDTVEAVRNLSFDLDRGETQIGRAHV